MCGIYITNISSELNLIEKKINLVEFRGPDNTGVKKVDDIILGHLRLAILDLEERSNQPFVFGDFYIVYNGEIYNFQSIKSELMHLGHSFTTTSDTEVLIAGYKQWGDKILSKLNGMFAFSIYDSVNRIVFSARDRLGVKPFYYYWKEGQFEICSQLRPIINKDSCINEESISIYLDCGYVPSPYSILKDVFKLPPGNFMIIDLKVGFKSIQEYWNLKPALIKDISYEEAVKELHILLIDAIKIRLQSDVSLGSFLSGGIDSALVSAIACKISDQPINTFTIGFEDPKYDESKVAAQFAEIIKSNHVETKCGAKDALKMLSKLIEVYDEPFADSSALPSLLLNSITKKYATVALSGDGGDESFFGYNHFDSVIKFDKLNKIPKGIRKRILVILGLKIFGNKAQHLRNILKVGGVIDFIKAIFIGYDSLQKKRNKDWLAAYEKSMTLSPYSLQKAADLNLKLWLENDSNVKVDRASMAFSVEVRSPFLDYRVIEYARTLPINYRYQPGRRKRILRDILKEYIPEEVFDQPKKGFSVPLDKWIREDLRDDIVEELNEKFLKKVPNLDVNKFQFELNSHLEGGQDHSFNVWKLYILSKWYKEFNF
ncbi:MAG: asparagine synthase (glutamine-hydrolyzing) [Ferruginibacter sp.]